MDCSWNFEQSNTHLARWKSLEKLICFFVQPLLSGHFFVKWCTSTTNQPRISDPCAIPFDSSYIMPMFSEVSKIAFYEVKLLIWVNLDFRVGPIGARNQKLRPLPDPFQRHKSSDDLRISKRASVKKHIFRGNPRYTILCEILDYILAGLYFGNQSYPWTCFDE